MQNINLNSTNKLSLQTLAPGDLFKHVKSWQEVCDFLSQYQPMKGTCAA